MSLGEDALIEQICSEADYRATKSTYYQNKRERLNPDKMEWTDKNSCVIDLYTVDEEYFANIIRFYEKDTKSQFPARVILNYMYFKRFGIKINLDRNKE